MRCVLDLGNFFHRLCFRPLHALLLVLDAGMMLAYRKEGAGSRARRGGAENLEGLYENG